MVLDLGFASLTVSFNRIEVVGKRGGTVRREGAVQEVPPVRGTLTPHLEELLVALGTVAWREPVEDGEVVVNRVPETAPAEEAESDGQAGVVRKEEPETGRESLAGTANSTTQAEAPAEGEAKTESPGSSTGTESRESTGTDGSEKPRVFRFFGGDGVSMIVAPSRNGAWISIAKSREGRIVEKSSGPVRLPRLMVLADMCGRALAAKRVIKPIPPVVVVADKGELSVMDGSVGTTFEPYQRMELFHLLSARFLGSDSRLNFRAGRFRLRENDGRLLLGFGRNEGEITPGDAMLLRSLCVV